VSTVTSPATAACYASGSRPAALAIAFEPVPELDSTKFLREEYAGSDRGVEPNTAFTLGGRGDELAVQDRQDDRGSLRLVVAGGFIPRSPGPPGLPPRLVRFTRDVRNEVTGLTLRTEQCEGVRFVKNAR
jgi:hypothetical protein